MSATTMDFQDANDNGVDDREESLEDRQTNVRGVDPSTQTDTASINDLQVGQNILGNIFGDPGSDDNELKNASRLAFQMDFGSKWADLGPTLGTSEYGLGQGKDTANYINKIDRHFNWEDKSTSYALNRMFNRGNMLDMNWFQDRAYDRSLNMLGAQSEQYRLNTDNLGWWQAYNQTVGGEQTRLNTAAAGEQSRLGTIVAGEQTRLNILATGQQTQKNIETQGLQDRLGWQVQGKEDRKNIAATGVENRLQAQTEGKETRKNIAATGVENRLQAVTEGKQTRKNIAATGVENRLQSQTEGIETRKNIAATGVENRLQAVTEGEQARLNIGKTAEEQRSTMSHADMISAGREKRQNAAARAGVRAM